MKSYDLFQETKRIGLPIKNAVEIGVFFSKNCVLKNFIDAGTMTTLVEADPLCIEDIRKNFGSLQNVKIEARAIWDERKTLSFFRAGASTFASDVNGSPAQVNDSYKRKEKDRFEVEAIPFSDIDDGKFNLVLIDVEGAEWNVLKTLVSRPEVLSLEMRAGLYQNPNSLKIQEWLKENNYKLWFHNDVDSVFIHQNHQLQNIHKLRYGLINLRTDVLYSIENTKKRLRRKLKG